MTDPDRPSSAEIYALYQKELQARQRAEEQRQQAEERRQQAEEGRQQAEEGRQQAEERRQQAEERAQQAEEQIQPLTFDDYIVACHEELWLPLVVGTASESTKGGIPAPTGKYCPTELRQWTDFESRQDEMYRVVRRFMQPTGETPPRPLTFFTLPMVKKLGKVLHRHPVRSENHLEKVQAYGVDEHVANILTELCQIRLARHELGLGVDFRFDSHRSGFDEEASHALDAETSKRKDTATGRMQPDQFCIHRVNEGTESLLLSAEYKPPHKLSKPNLCAGLRPRKFWDEVVNSETIPTDKDDKLLYNATRLAGAAIVQEYHVMLQEGLAYSYVSTGQAMVFLHVPVDEPATLEYSLCIPEEDVKAAGYKPFLRPLTAVARLLCLCLMACSEPVRDNKWRNMAMESSRLWETDFDYARSQVPDDERCKTPPCSEYFPSSPLSPLNAESGRRATRSQTRCTPLPEATQTDHSDSDPEPGSAAQRHKRNYSQIASSPPQPRVPPSQPGSTGGGGRHRRHSSPFCTQKCLLGLVERGPLDEACPNVVEHRRGRETSKHLIDVAEMVRLLNEQLNLDVDDCEPFGSIGACGAPFRLRCNAFGYTIVGKGTNTRLWGIVKREAEIYRTLRAVQGIAVPVFLGQIDLEQTYWLHRAGPIHHMLLMGWGGVPLTHDNYPSMSKEISQCLWKIRNLGVEHGDVRPQNVLWNTELNRVLLIDFHRSRLEVKQVGALKRGHRKVSDESGRRAKRQAKESRRLDGGIASE